MPVIRVLVRTAAMALALVIGHAARAEQGEDATLAASRARFGEAVSLVDEGRYEEALSRFRELNAAHPHPILLYNIGLCLVRLERNAEALDALDAYLSHGDDEPERLEAARTERDRLAALVVTEPEAEATPEPAPEPVEATAHPEESAESDASEVVVVGTDESERPRRRLRPALFWAFFGVTAATGASLAATGGITLHLSDRWLSEGDVDDRDQGRVLRAVSDGLVIALVCEAVVTLVLGLFTDFGASSGREVALAEW